MAEYQQDTLVPGTAGIDLVHPVDQIPRTKLARMTNLVRNQEGRLTARPGLAPVATAGVDIHTIARLTDGGTFTRVWGVDDNLAVGQAGALPTVDTGYSGRPLSLLPYRPALSADPWMYVGDDNRMRKVRGDGLNLPVGLVPPGAAVGSSLAAELRTNIQDFNTTAGWVFNAGTGSNLFPGVRILAEPGKVGNCLTFSVMPGAGGPNTPFYQFFIKNFAPINCNLVGGQPASDDDIIHLWARFIFPESIAEIKLYLITSANTDTETLPGTDETPGENNSDAYVVALRPSDFGPFILPDPTLSISPAVPSGERRVRNRFTSEELDRQHDTRGGAVELRRQMREGARIRAQQVITPKRAWTELGVIGVPLRRGDFLRIGTDEARSWGNINGICLLVEATGSVEEFPPGSIYTVCSLDDLYLKGGRGPDTSEPGSTRYDYRSVNIDILTGDKSNPSPIQAAGSFLDADRRGINVAPPAYVDPDYPAGQAAANIRQEIYRRGGSLTENWYFCGRNSSNGGGFLDTNSDAALQAAKTLEIDNDRPVTTVDPAGNIVEGVPLPSIWGPVQDLIFGCGEPNRPGNLYWCKPGFPGSWPPQNNREVTPPSDPLMAGWILGGRAFVFSMDLLWDILPDLTGNGQVTVVPTQCTKGLVGRRAFDVGKGACYFIHKAGVARTAGGAEEDITSGDLFPLFNPDGFTSVNGYPCFDPTAGDDARVLVLPNDEVMIWFRGLNGNIQVWVYSITFNYWRPYLFQRNVTNGEADKGTSDKTTILGSTVGAAFEHIGPEDDGIPIGCVLEPPALDQGLPRDYKRYGDLVLDIDRGNQAIQVFCFLDSNTRNVTAQPLLVNYESQDVQAFGGPVGGRQRFTLDPFTAAQPLPDDTNRARNVSVVLSFFSSAAGQPSVYLVGVSYIILPDLTIYRPLDWDVGGRPTDKWIKGITLEVDTFGRNKFVNIEADGQVLQQIQVNTSGRKVVQFSFPEQLGRVMRLQPAAVSFGVPWFLYSWDWIFDEEPLQLQRWETQELDFGIAGWKSPLFAWITMRAPSQVALTVTAYREQGSPIQAWPPFPYILPATGLTKRTLYVPFDASKGMLYKYVFQAPVGLHLHREESRVIVQPWGASEAIERPIWGNDDIDHVRGMSSARLVAAKGGGGA